MSAYVKDEEQHKADLERIKKFRLLDDDFMTKCFEGQIEATELVVNTILGVDWHVQSVRTQDTVKNLQGRSVRLDIHAVTGEGRRINIEIQRQDKGAAPKRARYHSSILDANTLLSGEEYENLPETYVIFITENDVLKYGKPIYRIERCVIDIGESFGDGSHIVYVNNEIQDETPLGRLMHDFACVSPDDMHYKALAERVRYFKETKEGVTAMCKIIEESNAEAVLEDRRRIARKFIEMGEMTLEKIAKALELPMEEIEEIARNTQTHKFA